MKRNTSLGSKVTSLHGYKGSSSTINALLKPNVKKRKKSQKLVSATNSVNEEKRPKKMKKSTKMIKDGHFDKVLKTEDNFLHHKRGKKSSNNTNFDLLSPRLWKKNNQMSKRIAMRSKKGTGKSIRAGKGDNLGKSKKLGGSKISSPNKSKQGKNGGSNSLTPLLNKRSHTLYLNGVNMKKPQPLKSRYKALNHLGYKPSNKKGGSYAAKNGNKVYSKSNILEKKERTHMRANISSADYSDSLSQNPPICQRNVTSLKANNGKKKSGKYGKKGSGIRGSVYERILHSGKGEQGKESAGGSNKDPLSVRRYIQKTVANYEKMSSGPGMQILGHRSVDLQKKGGKGKSKITYGSQMLK